jgi:predicted CopG family antitoxin
MDTTTVQVERPTKNILDDLKADYKVKTYDEVIKKLIKRKHKSMYGVLKDAGLSTKEITKEIRKERNSNK